VNTVERLRGARATTSRKVQVARLCAVWGEDVVWELQGIDALSVTALGVLQESAGSFVARDVNLQSSHRVAGDGNYFM